MPTLGMECTSRTRKRAEQAAALGYSAIAVTDRNSFSGIVRAHMAAKAAGIQFIPACRLDLIDGPSLLAYPTNIAAYGRLSALLTLGNRRTGKGKCELYKKDVYEHYEDILFVAVPPEKLNNRFEFNVDFLKDLTEYKAQFGRALYVAASFNYQGRDAKRLFRLAETTTAVTGQLLWPRSCRNSIRALSAMWAKPWAYPKIPLNA